MHYKPVPIRDSTHDPTVHAGNSLVFGADAASAVTAAAAAVAEAEAEAAAAAVAEVEAAAAAEAAEAAAGKGMRQKPLVFERSLKEKGATRF